MVLVPCVMTTPATAGSAAKIALMRLASVSQCAMVMSVLLMLAICSTLTRATWAISGTAATSSSPRSAPAL